MRSIVRSHVLEPCSQPGNFFLFFLSDFVEEKFVGLGPHLLSFFLFPIFFNHDRWLRLNRMDSRLLSLASRKDSMIFYYIYFRVNFWREADFSKEFFYLSEKRKRISTIFHYISR